MDTKYFAPACNVMLFKMNSTILNSSPFNAKGAVIVNTDGEVDLDEL